MTPQLIVCAGGLRSDYLITREGKAHVGLPGGNALYAAAGARLWTDAVALWARYGRNFPQTWLVELAAAGLGTAGLIALPEEHEHRTFYAYTPDGRRDDTQPEKHFTRIGRPLPPQLKGYIHSTPQQDDPRRFEPLAPRPVDWPTAYEAATAVHLAPLPLATHLHAPAALRAAGVHLISVDPGERYMIRQRIPFIRELLPQIDAFLPSDQEVRSLFGQDVNLWRAAEQLATWGAPLVIIKIGPQGILLLDNSNEDGVGKRHLPAYHGPGDPRIVDVTGAGDSFCGGFLAGLAETADPIQAVQTGLVSASLVIEGYGALYALNLDPSQAQSRLLEVQSG